VRDLLFGVVQQPPGIPSYVNPGLGNASTFYCNVPLIRVISRGLRPEGDDVKAIAESAGRITQPPQGRATQK